MTPEGWRNLTLTDIADVVGGVGFPRVHQGNQAGKLPFFKVSDMNTPGNERELRVAANTVSELLLGSLKGTLHPPGTVVFPKVGAALLTNKRRRLVVPSCFDNNVMGLVATGCDSVYLYLLMQTIDFAKYVQPGAVPSINGSTVGSIRVSVPPLAEQRRIAAILSSVDDAIEKTQAVIDQVQIVKSGLMQQLFTRGLPGRHARFKETEIGEIPEEWTTAPGIELFRLFGGYGPNAITLSDEGECLFIKVDSLNNRRNRRQIRHSVERFSKGENPTIRTHGKGALVVPKRGAAIFKNRVRPLGAAVAVDPNLMVLVPTERIQTEFLKYMLLHIGLFRTLP